MVGTKVTRSKASAPDGEDKGAPDGKEPATDEKTDGDGLQSKPRRRGRRGGRRRSGAKTESVPASSSPE